MPSLKSLKFGGDAFNECSRAVFESDSPSFNSLNRLASIGIHSNGWQCVLL